MVVHAYNLNTEVGRQDEFEVSLAYIERSRLKGRKKGKKKKERKESKQEERKASRKKRLIMAPDYFYN